MLTGAARLFRRRSTRPFGPGRSAARRCGSRVYARTTRREQHLDVARREESGAPCGPYTAAAAVTLAAGISSGRSLPARRRLELEMQRRAGAAAAAVPAGPAEREGARLPRWLRRVVAPRRAPRGYARAPAASICRTQKSGRAHVGRTPSATATPSSSARVGAPVVAVVMESQRGAGHRELRPAADANCQASGCRA
jgi:hypothetical protein